MFVSQFPTFDLGKYILREHSDQDHHAFFDYYADERVNQYILTQIPKTLEEARLDLNYWRNTFYTNNGMYFTIADKQSNIMVGTAGLSSYNKYNSRIEISYDIDYRHWRRGIGSAAVLTLIKYVFDHLKINRIEAITSIYNKASIGLLEKCGFVYEGKLRQHRFHRGKYVDVYSFSVLRDEYLNNPILHYPVIPLQY